MAGPYTRIVWNGAQVERVTREAMARGLNVATERLVAIVTPFTPYLEGDLSKAYGVHQATAESVEEGAQLQNHSRYAVAQHEGVMRYRRGGKTISWAVHRHTLDPHPQARTKFVEVPFRESRDELFGIVAQTIAGSLA